MARVLETDVGPIEIRLCGVDDDYILDFCPWEALPDLSKVDRPVSPLYREYSELLQDAYGGHAVAAWDGKLMVAALTFSPDGAVLPPTDEAYPRPCALSESNTQDYIDNLDLEVKSGILNMGCVAIHVKTDKYRRKKIALNMVEEAMAWAEQHGYLTVRALATPRTDDSEVWEKSADPGEAFWLAAGFEPTSRQIGEFVEMVRHTSSMPGGRPR